jgi:hypothetical protein
MANFASFTPSPYFIFRGRRGDLVKLVKLDGDGLWFLASVWRGEVRLAASFGSGGLSDASAVIDMVRRD